MTKAKLKRTYKDSVFADFFGTDKCAKSNFLSLYNALHGTELTLDCELRHIRLEQILYMNFYNDVSFLVDNKVIVLAEHQSTVNENMPSQTPYVRVPCLRRVFALQKHRVQRV